MVAACCFVAAAGCHATAVTPPGSQHLTLEQCTALRDSAKASLGRATWAAPPDASHAADAAGEFGELWLRFGDRVETADRSRACASGTEIVLGRARALLLAGAPGQSFRGLRAFLDDDSGIGDTPEAWLTSREALLSLGLFDLAAIASAAYVRTARYEGPVSARMAVSAIALFAALSDGEALDTLAPEFVERVEPAAGAAIVVMHAEHYASLQDWDPVRRIADEKGVAFVEEHGGAVLAAHLQRLSMDAHAGDGARGEQRARAAQVLQMWEGAAHGAPRPATRPEGFSPAVWERALDAPLAAAAVLSRTEEEPAEPLSALESLRGKPRELASELDVSVRRQVTAAEKNTEPYRRVLALGDWISPSRRIAAEREVGRLQVAALEWIAALSGFEEGLTVASRASFEKQRRAAEEHLLAQARAAFERCVALADQVPTLESESIECRRFIAARGGDASRVFDEAMPAPTWRGRGLPEPSAAKLR